MNFIFTTCKTVCLPMGANFGRLAKLLDRQGDKDVALISLTVDALTDTPERLNAWEAQFGASDRWTLLTGTKTDVDRALKSLGAFTADKQQHPSTLLIGQADSRRWERLSALASPDTLMKALTDFEEQVKLMPANLPTSTSTAAPPAAQQYFTDVVLTDQDGKPERLYSDLLKGHVVIINAFFTACKDSCPVMAGNFARLQTAFADRLGKDMFMLSLSVDPANDTPAILKQYAERFKAREGWYFLSGSEENVYFALGKLGLYPESGKRDNHLTVFIIGNEPTGLWKKARGTARPDEILQVVQSVLTDRG